LLFFNFSVFSMRVPGWCGLIRTGVRINNSRYYSEMEMKNHQHVQINMGYYAHIVIKSFFHSKNARFALFI
ncbi:MAG: hypothetical protein ACTH5R_00180, partial [Vibrio litoralis]